MPRFSFRFAAKDHVVLDEIGKYMADLYEAHAYALSMIRGIQSISPAEDDWRGWTVKIIDESGHGVLTVMFPNPRRTTQTDPLSLRSGHAVSLDAGTACPTQP